MMILKIYDHRFTSRRESKYYYDILSPATYSVPLDGEVIIKIKMRMRSRRRKKPFHIHIHPDLKNFSGLSLTVPPNHEKTITLRLENSKIRPFSPYRYEWNRRELLENGTITLAEGTPIFRIFAYNCQKFKVRII